MSKKPQRENLLKRKKVFVTVLVVFGVISIYELGTLRMQEINDEKAKVSASSAH